jgi:hypothetical protein
MTVVDFSRLKRPHVVGEFEQQLEPQERAKLHDAFAIS